MRRLKGAFVKRSLLFLLCAALLSACTVTFTPADVSVSGRVRFGIQLSDVVTTFEPTRGRGAIYGLNESISFRLRSAQSGYITLTAIDPTGEVYPIIRNVYVRAGETRIISELGRWRDL